jgi:hypothetical protein
MLLMAAAAVEDDIAEMLRPRLTVPTPLEEVLVDWGYFNPKWYQDNMNETKAKQCQALLRLAEYARILRSQRGDPP